MARPIKLMSTAYGPTSEGQWGGIQGTGVTATGIDLRKHPKQYVVAVDPKVIPLGSKLKIPHNPFGDPNIVFTAADTGGAIKGSRLDFYDWRGRKTQMDWGTRPIEASIVGKGGKPGAPGGQGGTAATFLPGAQQGAGVNDVASGADISQLISQLMAPQGGRGIGGGLTDPSFSARASLALPKTYQPIQSSGGPAPKPDLSSVIGSILPALQGGGIPQAQSPGLVVPGMPGSGGAGGSPVKGTIVGSPLAGVKPHGATHPTAGLPGYPAYDYMGRAGAAVVAPVSGKIVRFSGHDPAAGPTQGPHGPFGYSIYLQGDDGRTYYLTHLGSRDVKVGQRVKQGVQIGTIGDYAKFGGANHVHVGVHG